MQKVVTVFLDDSIKATHGVQEHLTELLRDGWKVVSMVPVGSSVGSGGETSHPQEGKVKGWLAVLLEQ